MNAGSCGGPERKSLGTAKEHNQIAARRMSPLNPGSGDINAGGTFEQGSDGRHADLCRVEHARDGCRSHGLSDLPAATQCPAGHARAAGQFRLDAPWRARPGEGALARRTLWGRTAAARLCGWRAVLAEARRTCQGQPRICRWRDGAADGCHRWLSAYGPASAAPGGHC